MKTEGHETIQRDFLRELSDRGDKNFSIGMAPMIDIVFLLLIFFLVAGNWRGKEDFLLMELGAYADGSGVAGKVEALQIEIRAAADGEGCEVRLGSWGKVTIGGGEGVEEELLGLAEEMRSYMVSKKRRRSDPVEICCDDDVLWDHSAKIYNVFCGMGLSDITFVMREQ